MTTRVYTIQEQEQLLRRAGPIVHNRLMCVLHRKHHDLLELGIKRVVDLGEAQYGDASFHKSTDQLKLEVNEELADALVYETIYSLKLNGAI